MFVGINVAPDGTTPIRDVVDLNVSAVRMVPRWGEDIRDYLAELRQHGIRALLVVARESFPSGDVSDWAIREIVKWYGDSADWWQIGNEPDHEGDGSSWTTTADEWIELAQDFDAALERVGKTRPLISGGLVSGHPDWLDQIGARELQRIFDALAVHPYAKVPSEQWNGRPVPNFGTVGSLLEQYERFGLPLWVTETGVSWPQVPEHWRRAFYPQMIHAVAEAEAEACFPFCLHDYAGWGLLRDGERLPSYVSTADVAAGYLEEPRPIVVPPIILDPPPETPEEPMPAPPEPPVTDGYRVGDGVRAAMRAAGVRPASDETFFPELDGLTKRPTADGHHQWSDTVATDGSTFRWIKATGAVVRFPPAA